MQDEQMQKTLSQVSGMKVGAFKEQKVSVAEVQGRVKNDKTGRGKQEPELRQKSRNTFLVTFIILQQTNMLITYTHICVHKLIYITRNTFF